MRHRSKTEDARREEGVEKTEWREGGREGERDPVYTCVSDCVEQ